MKLSLTTTETNSLKEIENKLSLLVCDLKMKARESLEDDGSYEDYLKNRTYLSAVRLILKEATGGN